jgi:HK97 gp10 family phage protein
MMAKPKIKVEGVAKAIAKADAMTLATKARVRAHIMATAEAVKNSARARARKRSGKMANSIQVRITNGGLGAEVGPTKPDGWYAHFHEFGTVKMSAHPFMTPAWEENRPKLMAGFKDVVEP